MPDFSHHIVPIPQPDVEEVFAVHQTTYAFYEEVRVRQAFEQYCQWYEQVADQHRRELTAMREEFNLIRWFYRR
jgi:microcompartment protein CcmL/EutN